jgi:hypothetical protein
MENMQLPRGLLRLDEKGAPHTEPIVPSAPTPAPFKPEEKPLTWESVFQ